MPFDPDCVFCKIVRGEIPAAKVLETPTAIAFLDIHPIAAGHTLLATKEHYPTVSDVPAEVMGAVAKELPRLAQAVLKASGAPALNVIINSGRESGQEVPHLHFHLLPRQAGDAVRVRWPRQTYPGDEMEQVRRRIAEAVG